MGSENVSSQNTPKPLKHDADATLDFYTFIEHIRKRINIILVSFIISIFVGLKSRSFYQFALRLFVLFSSIYILMFVLYEKRGGRAITEYYLISLIIVSNIYFVVKSSNTFFLISILTCLISGLLYQYLP